jgi:hypothetical protein
MKHSEAIVSEPADVPPGVDVTRPSPARMYDYYLGGTHNFPVDREAAERIRKVMPDLADAAFANRGFHQRAAIWMAERGIRQFLDLGAGLPTRGNTHQAVAKVTGDARVVYVDIDPMVAAYAGHFLEESRRTAVVTADMRDPEAVLGHPEVVRLIDFAEPAGLLMTAVVHFVADGSDPWGLVRRYLGALAPDSYLALSHVTHEKLPPRAVAAGEQEYQRSSEPIYLRSKAEIERFFDGLEIVAPYEGAAPAVCHVGLWGAEDPEAADSEGSRAFFCAVARKP